MTKLLEQYRSTYSATADEEMSLEDFLALCKKDPTAYATASERMLAAIGEPELFDTRNDPRLSRIFGNRVIRRYPAFREFFGMEDAIDQIVSFFRHAAQGLEERKQILYLLGPVGGGLFGPFPDGTPSLKAASKVNHVRLRSGFTGNVFGFGVLGGMALRERAANRASRVPVEA